MAQCSPNTSRGAQIASANQGPASQSLLSQPSRFRCVGGIDLQRLDVVDFHGVQALCASQVDQRAVKKSGSPKHSFVLMVIREHDKICDRACAKCQHRWKIAKSEEAKMSTSGTTRTECTSPRGIQVLTKCFQLVAINGGTEQRFHERTPPCQTVEGKRPLPQQTVQGTPQRLNDTTSVGTDGEEEEDKEL